MCIYILLATTSSIFIHAHRVILHCLHAGIIINVIFLSSKGSCFTQALKIVQGLTMSL